MSYAEAILLGVIEGLTEFLPVSSTGHLILVKALLNSTQTGFSKSFIVVIQLGAILSVLTLYYKRLLHGWEMYVKLTVAFIPTGIAGMFLYKLLKQYLFNPYFVSFALIAGGIVMVIADKWAVNKESRYADTPQISYSGAFRIGLMQCLSIFPGVSRAAATIYGGLLSGMDRKQSAEFSFLLAIPTMCAATGYDLYKTGGSFTNGEFMVMAAGAAVAFISAFLAVKSFIALLNRHGFIYFGYYRILAGVIFLLLFGLGSLEFSGE